MSYVEAYLVKKKLKKEKKIYNLMEFSRLVLE
jgi:hypothetical protein